MIKLEDCKEIAETLEVEAEAIFAVARVESGKSLEAFLFEPHVFSRLTKGKYDKTHPSISYTKWDRTKYPKSKVNRQIQFDAAAILEPFKAYESTSWGLFQIMGFHYKVLGYSNALNMAAQLRSSVPANIKAFGLLISHMGIVESLRNKEWAKFARVYNGPSYRLNRYDSKMATAYDSIIKDSSKNLNA